MNLKSEDYQGYTGIGRPLLTQLLFIPGAIATDSPGAAHPDFISLYWLIANG